MDTYIDKSLANIPFNTYYLSVQKNVNKLYPSNKSNDERLLHTQSILSSCHKEPPEEFVPKYFDVVTEVRDWLIWFMYLEKYVINEIWGVKTFPFVADYVEKNKAWFYDKLFVVLCMLYHQASFFQVENILQTHFEGHITPSPSVYEFQYFFLHTLLKKADDLHKKSKGRPPYPSEVENILKLYRKKKNKKRMQRIYYENHFSQDEVTFLYELCNRHAPEKTELINKLQLYM